LDSLMQVNPYGRGSRVVVSPEGLERADKRRVDSILASYMKAFSGTRGFVAEWASAPFGSLVKQLCGASYYWRADDLVIDDSSASYGVQLAAACGSTMLAWEADERWPSLASNKRVNLGSRFDALGLVFAMGGQQPVDNNESGDSRAWLRKMVDGFETTIERLFRRIRTEGEATVAPTSKDILVSGWYGSGNIGDELILKTLIQSLSKVDPAARLRIVTPLPAKAERFHGIPCVDRNDHVAVESAVQNCSAAIVGGGGLFQDYAFGAAGGVAGMIASPKQSIGAYAALPFFCEVWDRPWHGFGQGIGPLRTDAGRGAVRRLMRSAESLVVRDHESKQLLESLLGPGRPVEWAPDIVFGMEFDYSAHASRVNSADRYIVLNLRPWAFDGSYEPQLVLEQCLKFAAINGLVVVGLAMAMEDHDLLDRLFADAILSGVDANMLQLLPFILDENQLLRDISDAEVVIGMRYHVNVLGCLADTPTVGIAYDPKVSNLFAELNATEFLLELEDISTDGLAQVLVNGLELGGHPSQDVSAKIEYFKSESERQTRDLMTRLVTA